MRFTIITASYNTAPYLEQAILSVLAQRQSGIDVQYIVVDGGSSDATPDILARYSSEISHLIVEPDSGPANALNKGLRLAEGDMVAWLNADDLYYPDTLARVRDCAAGYPRAAMYFGRCPIVDQQGQEIRSLITRIKELFFPLSSRFIYQCINYLSQPALFFRQEALAQAGPLREDMVAAWDYEFILRLWHWGPAVRVAGNEPLAAFRWHPASISGSHFATQFREGYEAAVADAGRFSPQALLHFFVRWGIVGIYYLLALKRSPAAAQRKA